MKQEEHASDHASKTNSLVDARAPRIADAVASFSLTSRSSRLIELSSIAK